MRKNYEQPRLEYIRVSTVDVLLASGGSTEPTVLHGSLAEGYTGAKTELRYSDLWNGAYIGKSKNRRFPVGFSLPAAHEKRKRRSVSFLI